MPTALTALSMFWPVWSGLASDVCNKIQCIVRTHSAARPHDRAPMVLQCADIERVHNVKLPQAHNGVVCQVSCPKMDCWASSGMVVKTLHRLQGLTLKYGPKDAPLHGHCAVYIYGTYASPTYIYIYILQGRLARSQKAMEHSQQYPPILPGPEHTWVAAQV